MKYIEQQPRIRNEAWHSLEVSQIFQKLQSGIDGLSSQEVEQKLQLYGENNLPLKKGLMLWQIILYQLLNPLVFILIVASAASIAIGDAKDAIFIFLVILINTALGAYQEHTAERSAKSLQSLLKIKSRVKRNKKVQEFPSEVLVPGDIVYLESGLKVPADIRLIEELNLAIDESFLTGESVPSKKELTVLAQDIDVNDRTNMAYAGSTVMSGRGIGIVVSTGVNTEVGKIASDVTETKSAKPPLIIRMEKLVKQICIFFVGLSIVMVIILKMQGVNYTSIFFSVVALAVSAIPEGLPVALTVVLSIATKRMAKRNVIVRKLTSVESLGSCTIIASDKTGTLTLNEQTVKRIILPDGKSFSVTGEGYNGEGGIFDDFDNSKNDIANKYDIRLYEINKMSVLANEGALNKENDKWIYHGDAIDVAFLGLSYKLGLNPDDIRSEFKLIDQIPYESEKQFSAAFYDNKGVIHVGVKGAVETVLGFCSYIFTGKGLSVLNKNVIEQQASDMAKKGYRVLAVAGGNVKTIEGKLTVNSNLSDLAFYGLICFIDPLRAESKESVTKCKKAGIKVIMITGDHPSTAETIAQELGISDSNQSAITGKMLTETGSADSHNFKELASSTSVFARVSPSQKLEIVNSLIKNGEFVAVTGDGVNDSPALKRANIGVAMGSGTDVAKEISSMIVIDDNFSSIVSGVEEGRFAYDNVRKVIYLLISTGIAEILLFIASILTGLPLPLLPVQLLWLNLATNGIQHIGLACESGEKGTMLKKPRRPNESIFNSLMIKETVISAITIATIALGIWFWLINYDQMEEFRARNIILLLMVFMENVHVFNCRSETISIFKIPLNKNFFLIFGILIAQGIHIISMHVPFMQNVLRIESVTFTEWVRILILAIPLLLVMEIFKFLNSRTYKTNIM